MEEEQLPAWWVGTEEAEWSRGGAFSPLVFLVGLNATGSDRSLWDNLRLHANKDFSPNYVHLPLTHKLPPKKAKRPEGTLPVDVKGILSSKWIQKHKDVIPAVIVVFITSTDAQAVGRIRELKAESNAHGSVLLVVLLEGHSISEGSVSVEKASALCAAVDLPPKSLFLLPHATHPDRIAASLHRLETGIKEGAKTYYGGRVRRVRTSKERIPPSYLVLNARYAFKLGFFHEVRRDYVAAISSYEGTVEAVKGIGGMEGRAVGGLATLRMTRLYLLRGEAREAKAAMDKVANMFKTRGDVEEFEHWAWLQTLWGNFAELVREEHRRIPVPVNNTIILDPVTFFLAAAKWARLRAHRVKSTSPVEWPPVMDSWKVKGDVKYFGQRPWVGEVKEILDPLFVVQALTYLEQRTEHSASVIRYLGVASDFCKDYRPRTRSQLMALMGEEFCSGAEWDKALILATHIVNEIGGEKWGAVLAHASKLGLRAAEAEPNPSHYVAFATVLLSSELRHLVMEEVQQSLWTNLKAVRQKQPPPVPIFPDSYDVHKWATKLTTPILSYVRVHRRAIVEARASFSSDSVKVNEPCDVKVHLKLNKDTVIASETLSVRRIAITTSVPELEVSKDVNLSLEGTGKEEILNVTLTPTSKEAGKVLTLGVVSVDIGNDQNCQIILHYSPKLYSNPTLWVNDDEEGSTMWKNAVRVEGAKAEAAVALDIVPPLLSGERRRVDITLENMHKAKISKVSLALLTYPIQMRVQTGGEYKAGGAFEELDSLQGGGSSHSSTVWVDVIKDGNPGSEMTFVGRARYTDVHGENLTAEKALVFDLVRPFEVTEETRHAASGESLGKLIEGAVFLHIWTLRNVSGIDLTIRNIDVSILSVDVTQVGNKVVDSGTKVLKSGEEFSSFLLLQVSSLPCSFNPLAKLQLQWTRERVEGTVWSDFESLLVGKLSATSHENNTSAIEVFVRGVVGKAVLKRSLSLSLAIKNPTPFVLDLSLNMDSTEYFMTAGPKKMGVKIGGGEETFLDYILFPLKTGLLRLPSLGVECLAGPVNVIRDVPPTVFVTRESPTD